jgi:molybdopterin/thiamine biosynthesis adenylyltransferase/rhodanese-related sulfurtransferase
MAKTFQALMAAAQGAARAVPLDELRRRVEAREALTLVDVREAEEFRAGHIPGAVSAPRAFLEARIEEIAPDRDAPLVLYCAGGARAALAARTLVEMGYARVERADPGFTQWRAQGFPTAAPRALTAEQRARYARHLTLPEVGEAGQRALLDARVLLVGAGGLGSPAALYLAAAGVGTLGLVDADAVDASNLQRQVLHTTARVGALKVDSAEAQLRALNPDVRVEKHPERLTRANVDRIVAAYDVIVDGCDNFPTRYLVSDASVLHRKPVVHGSVARFEGQVTTFVPPSGPCYRCLYPQPPPAHLAPSCQEAGVLGVLPGVIGLLQATEALKLILGRGDALVGRVLTYDALAMTFRALRYKRDRECPRCGERPTLDGYVDYEGFCEGR